MTHDTTALAPGSEHDARPVGGVFRFLPALTLIAVVTVTASSEWTLARTVLDLPPAVAWAVPVAIDSYVIAALHARRDVAPALAVMTGALLTATGAHLAAAEYPDGELPVTATAPAAAVIMCVLVVVAWRVHTLLTPDAAAPSGGRSAAPRPVAADPAAVAVTEPAVTQVRVTSGTPVPVLVTELASGSGTTVPELTPGTRGRAHSAPARSTVSSGRAWSDAEILADLAGRVPSVRALRRDYGVGASRAARLRTAAGRSVVAHARAEPHAPNTETSPKNPDQELPLTINGISASNSIAADSQHHPKNADQECTDKDQTHHTQASSTK
ncbi:MAG: hypothetical protein ACRCYU_11295 [Nocardioides sp.]